MGFYDLLKGIFKRSPQRQLLVAAGELPPSASAISDAQSRFDIDLEAELAKHLVEIEKEALTFSKHYGADFHSFLYQPDLADFIRREVLPFRDPSNASNHFLDHSHWADIHYLNFPGPFYTGQSDTCGTGEYQAPHNVLNDGPYAQEYVFRQPQNYAEFLCLVDAAAVEVLDSYSCDGNQYWTYQLCREWWRGKPAIIRRLNTPAFQKYNGDRIQLYLDYLNGAAETDLRKYCYFLENGSYPEDGQVLPPL